MIWSGCRKIIERVFIREPAHRQQRFRPTVEALESREVPYAATVLHWAMTDISASFMPNGTSAYGDTSALFSHLNTAGPAADWQREFARALQTWANYTPLNFHFVSDDGSRGGIWGLVQGDSRFGDIRLAAIPLSGALAATIFPNGQGAVQGGTDAGDIILSTGYPFRIGSTYDLYSLLLHESGHALGLGHSAAGTVMYGTYSGVKSGLTADDVAGIRAMYGTRQPDSYDASASNNTLAAASSLSLTAGTARFRADLTSQADIDFYAVTASDSALTVTVDPRSLSLLAPKVLVYDAAGVLLGSAIANYGQATTLNLTGLVAGQTYYLVADGAAANVFGMGAYVLDAQFGPEPPPAAPSSLQAAAASTAQIDLTWEDNSTNETGFRIEQSLDGVNYTLAGTVAAGETHYSVTGLSAGTAYQFRVSASGTEEDSPWSSAIEAVPHAAYEDAREFNDTQAAAIGLSRRNNFSERSLSFHISTDMDNFKFRARTTGRFLISAQLVHAAGDLELKVYNNAGRLLGTSSSLDAAASLTLKLYQGNRYYVEVSCVGGEVNSYDLTLRKLASVPAAAQVPSSSEGSEPRNGSALRWVPGCGCSLCTGSTLQATPVRTSNPEPAAPVPAFAAPISSELRGWLSQETLTAMSPLSERLRILDEVFAQFSELDEGLTRASGWETRP